MQQEPGSRRPIDRRMPQTTGTPNGEQSTADWAAGESDDRPVLDLPLGMSVWRIGLYGVNVVFRVVYGTKANKIIEGLASPALLSIPGQCAVYARPLDPEVAASARVTATPATAGGNSARYIVDTAGAALDPDAAHFQALTASTVTIRGIAVAVPVLGVVPLVAGSVLTAGSGYLEFNP